MTKAEMTTIADALSAKSSTWRGSVLDRMTGETVYTCERSTWEEANRMASSKAPGDRYRVVVEQ